MPAACQCNASPNTVAAAGRSDYGTFCASWDAPDEKPWCRVASANACGLDTFSSTAGVFWSYAPCKGKPAGAPPPPSVTASKGSAASAHAQAPEKCVGDAMVCRRKVALRGCGALCDYSGAKTAKPGPFFQSLRKPVDCTALFSNTESDAPAKTWPPPRTPPPNMRADYSMNGKVTISSYYFAEKYAGTSDASENTNTKHIARETIWTKAEVDRQIAQARARALPGTYGQYETNNVINAIFGADSACQQHPDMCLKGKHIMVIGSERPWLEALLLAGGASHVTTVEYGVIKSLHPQISTMLPSELRAKFLAGTLKPFDGVATFSSVEHSGLGRYGDALNPWGDIQAIGKAWCVTKVGGPLFIGVMGTKGGAEMIEWNAHRRYGPVRYPHLVANWEQVARGPQGSVEYDYWQALYTLRRLPAV